MAVEAAEGRARDREVAGLRPPAPREDSLMTTIRTRRLTVTAIVLMLVTASLILVNPPTSAEAAADPVREADFVQLINQERTRRGLSPLCVAHDLTRVARSHSVDMRAKTLLHHNPDLGGDVTNWKRLAENVGVGYGTTSLHKAFMESPGHRANILDGRVTQIGIGIEVESSGRVWVTQVFRLPAKASASPCKASSTTARVPLTGDWDGDGTSTPGWWRDGYFTLSNRHDGGGPLIKFRYGTGDDQPLVGDWNGDGRDTVGIVRDREWHLVNSHRGGSSDISFVYGRTTRGDIPLTGDWNGDGVGTPAIVRDGEWHFKNRHQGGPSDFHFLYGRVTRGDIPFVGDWNGDGVDTAGIIRDGDWHLVNRHRGGASDVSFTYGRVSRGDTPLVGDWDGDGDSDVAVTRNGTWHYRLRLAGGAANWSHTWLP